MEDQGIIKTATGPTDWVNALCVVEKTKIGKLRVCLDPWDLNKAIKCLHYPLTTLDEMTPKLTGASYFSIMDARSGYWAVKLSEKSSKLTTFNTIFGRYRFCAYLSALSRLRSFFNRNQIKSMKVAWLRDILVYGKTKEDHDRNLRTMMEWS